VNIIKPAWRSVREVSNLDDHGVSTGFDEPTRGVIFEAERGNLYAYMAEIDGRIKYVVPICNDEYAFDTADEAAACQQLMEFAVGEGMFPSFNESIARVISDFIELNVATEVMRDRESGDIAPEQSEIERQAVSEIADVLVAVWAQNRRRS
jgi:hypothetical protein